MTRLRSTRQPGTACGGLFDDELRAAIDRVEKELEASIAPSP
ncbi:hypothetical protein [Streptomyces griseorubiginosus]|nr:hypothetical protein [Streptomyces griseorubiginosus]